MIVYETKKFPCIIDTMDTDVHYLSLILSLSKRESKGGLDSTTKGRETKMLIRAAIICSSNGWSLPRVRYMHARKACS